MLKSSDRVAHDASEALLPPCAGDDESTDENVAAAAAARPRRAAEPEGGHVLVLRRWYDLRPEREFRCFVRAGGLVGAPRHRCFPLMPCCRLLCRCACQASA